MNNDPRELFRRAAAQTGTVIAAIRPEQADLPTPCTDWAVRTLVSHTAGAVTRIALVGEGADALSLPPFADLGDDWTGCYRQAAARAEAAWADDAKLDALFAVPWGKVPGRVAVSGYVRVVVAHGWDLAVATGQRLELPADLLAHLHDTVFASVEQGRQMGMYGPQIAVPADAPALDRILGLTGRDPAWT
ncbi:MAG TPA: TIGR03086 family metal-binding protein [Trebonia sp.]|nr:TIGR03086 family metal-binding protein [Trebonia sp.]